MKMLLFTEVKVDNMVFSCECKRGGELWSIKY